MGETALRYLNCREAELGGYRTEVVSFTPRQGRAFQVLLYIATPDSREWSGPTPLPRIARQITACRGPAGHNLEYLLRLADFIKDNDLCLNGQSLQHPCAGESTGRGVCWLQEEASRQRVSRTFPRRFPARSCAV